MVQCHCPSLIPITKRRFFLLLGGLIINVVVFSVLELSPLINGTLREPPALIHAIDGDESDMRIVQALDGNMQIIGGAQGKCDNHLGCQWLHCHLVTNFSAPWIAYHFIHPFEYCAPKVPITLAPKVPITSSLAPNVTLESPHLAQEEIVDKARIMMALDPDFNIIPANYTTMFECTSDVDCHTVSCQLIHLLNARWIAVQLLSPVTYCQNLHFTQHARLSLAFISACLGVLVIVSMAILQGIATHRVGQLALHSNFYPSGFEYSPVNDVDANEDDDGLANPAMIKPGQEYQRLALDSSTWSVLNLAFFIAYAILWINACVAMMMDCVHTWPTRLARVALLSWSLIVLTLVSALS
jgi:hypothetical protein